jgi:hypothetical protein
MQLLGSRALLGTLGANDLDHLPLVMARQDSRKAITRPKVALRTSTAGGQVESLLGCFFELTYWNKFGINL